MHTEAPISITVKSKAGSLVTVRAATAEELDQTVALALASLSSATQELETAIAAIATIAGTNTAVPPQPAIAAVVAAFNATDVVTTPGAGARQCPHGTMTRIHGLTGKFGPYKGHFCPAKQGDPTKCTTVYVKAGSAEFATFQADQTKA